MSGIIVWKIIGYGVVAFIGLGIAFSILSAAFAILSPVLLVAFYALSVVTYPLTLALRLLGFRCRSLFTFGCDIYNAWKVRKAGTQTQYQSKTSYQQEPPKPAPKAPQVNPWSLLGVEKGASKEAINSAFRKKMMLNHPDKVATLDPTLQNYATKRTVLIQQAYEELMKAV